MTRGYLSTARFLIVIAILIAMVVFFVGMLQSGHNEPELLWGANHETGDLSQWTEGQNGEAVFDSGTGGVTITRAVSHSGQYGLNLTITNALGVEDQGARIFRWAENPVEAYYGVWLYFPEEYAAGPWWNVFQFKSKRDESEPIWSLNIDNQPDGEMYFYLWDSLSEQSHGPPGRIKAIPVRRWFHIEAFYRRTIDSTGRITIWQDGVEIIDVDGVQTATSEYGQWSVNNYASRVEPSNVTIFADDATISATRVGP